MLAAYMSLPGTCLPYDANKTLNVLFPSVSTLVSINVV